MKVADRRCHLYRAIDREGALLDYMPSEHRDGDAALRLLDVTGSRPERVTTDKPPSY